MKSIFLAATAAATMLASAPAFAAEGDIELTASVAKACGVGFHKSGATAAPGWDQPTAPIGVNLTNGGNGQFTGFDAGTNLSFGNIWCNGPANVTFEIEALRSTSSTPDTGSFTNRFDVEVSTNMAVYLGDAAGTTYSTAGTPDGEFTKGFIVPHAFETGLQSYSGVNSIKVLADGSNRRAVAGDYSGIVRFTATTN